MKINSRSELVQLRNTLKNKIELRETGAVTEDNVEILIGMATCGIASGARDTYNALLSVISEKKLKNVSVISVGCLGYCYMEPTVQVCIPGQEPLLYGKITKEKASELIEKVVIGKGFLSENLLIKSYDKAGAQYE